MNERIKQLVEKSYIYDKQNDSSFFNKEKFAELIVRECADIAESFHRHQYDMTGNLELHEFIREHFGVEE